MKRYKLIREYPGSPKLESIVKLKDNGGYELENSTSYFMTKDKVEKFPEFWQPVVEKDYEILNFISIENNIAQLSYFTCENNFTGNNIWKIYSIKRKSDGEIFTISDKVFSEYVNYTINKIVIVNDKCMVSALYDTNNPNGSRLHYNLNNLKKVKQPLFTTEDSVDIFEGDVYWLVTEKYNYGIHYTRVNSDYTETLKNNNKRFSTKEKAEEYILYNKPLLTLKDIEELLCKNTSSYFLEKFKKRAQKLNK